MASPSIGTSPKEPIKGNVNQDLIDAAIKKTAIKGSPTNGDFDPDMFLKILMEQLKNQNPFDSVDTSEILQQQAMLTQVEQVTRQTDSLKAVQAEVEQSFTEISKTLIDMKGLLSQIKDK